MVVQSYSSYFKMNGLLSVLSEVYMYVFYVPKVHKSLKYGAGHITRYHVRLTWNQPGGTGSTLLAVGALSRVGTALSSPTNHPDPPVVLAGVMRQISDVTLQSNGVDRSGPEPSLTSTIYKSIFVSKFGIKQGSSVHPPVNEPLMEKIQVHSKTTIVIPEPKRGGGRGTYPAGSLADTRARLKHFPHAAAHFRARLGPRAISQKRCAAASQVTTRVKET